MEELIELMFNNRKMTPNPPSDMAIVFLLYSEKLTLHMHPARTPTDRVAHVSAMFSTLFVCYGMN